MKNENKGKFLEKHPFAGLLVLYLTAFVIIQVIGSLADTVIQLYIWPDYPGNIISIAICFPVLWLFKKRFSPYYDGSLHARGTLKGILYMWPVIPFLIFWAVFLNPEADFLTNFVSAAWAGVNEETIFRGIAVAFLMYHFRKAKNIPWIVLGTGLIFGVYHMSNILIGGSVSGTLSQALNAAALGMMFAAAFLRTGTLWSGMIIHALYDFLQFMMTANQGGNLGVDSSSFDISRLIIVIPIIVYVATAFVLTRPSKRDEIITLWNHKWNAES